MKTFQEFMVIAEGMTMKDFKANRRKIKRKEASTDAKKRGHVGKEWYNSGRTYSPDEAKSGRTNMPDHERRTRHRSAVDPDNDNDDMYSADKTKNPKKLRKQKAMGELGEEALDEIHMITPVSKKSQSASKSKSDKDRYGEDPAVTRKRLALKVKKLKEEGEIEEGIGMTMANALGNPPALSKRMKLKQALIINKIKSDAKKNAGKKYSGKAATSEEYEIDESSLSRVVSKTKKGGIAIMSSDRGDKTNKEKQQRSNTLVKRIRGAGLPGPTKVKGAYHEKDHGEQTEKSFVVGSGKQGKRKFKKTVTKLGQEGGLKHKRNQKPDSKKDDQDSVLIKQKPGNDSKASWLGTSRRSDADPKLGKKYDQGKLSTKDANKSLKPGEGATIVGKKKMQFK